MKSLLKLLLTIGLFFASVNLVGATPGSTTISSTMNTSTLTRNADMTLTLTTSSSGTTTSQGTSSIATGTTLSGASSSGNTITHQAVVTTLSGTQMTRPVFQKENGPALDLKSTEVTHYREALLKDAGIRYANPVYSVRVRAGASKKTTTVQYLIKNDAVQLSSTGGTTGWGKVSTQKTSGYIARKYLRDPNPTDLVRIHQADQAYWSDIGRAQVAHKVNVRVAPVYGSHILAVFDDSTPLYILDEVNGWTEIMTDSGVHGYIKSQYVVTTKVQKEDWIKGVR